MSARAYVTLLTDPSYVAGAEVLGFSLAESGTTVERVALATAAVGSASRRRLAAVWDRVVDVEPVANPNPPQGIAAERMTTTYTKLRVWELAHYETVVYLDADTLVLAPVDDLFERPELAAAPNRYPPDTFNSGVMVLSPSAETAASMREAVGSTFSVDGGDQGFLNSYFADWYTGPGEHRLPATDNALQGYYLNGAVWRWLLPAVRIAHYHGPLKPWRYPGRRRRRFSERVLARFFDADATVTSPHTLWWRARERFEAWSG